MTGDRSLESDSELRSFADEHGLSIAAARTLLDELRAQAGAGHFYVFWTTGGGGGGGGAGRQRTLLAFPTPDAALAFAQRHQLARATEQPRLRRLALFQLVQAILREPAIAALLIVEDSQDLPIPAGQLPRGLRFERTELVNLMKRHADI
jgi:hypothetical protein